MPFFRFFTYQSNAPGEAIVKWATADINKNTATIMPNGRYTSTFVSGQSLPRELLYVRNDVVIGSLKLLVRRIISNAWTRCRKPMKRFQRRSLLNCGS